MKCQIPCRQRYVHLLLPAIVSLSFLLSIEVVSQEKRAIKGEPAACQVSIVNQPGSKAAGPPRNYTPLLNQLGYFDQISNIKPHQKVAVQVAYPKGKRGEKTWVIVLDGGSLDNNRKEQIVQLDVHRKLSFNFQAGRDPGIYRILLKRANDTKIVQLWVGPETLPVKK